MNLSIFLTHGTYHLEGAKGEPQALRITLFGNDDDVGTCTLLRVGRLALWWSKPWHVGRSKDRTDLYLGLLSLSWAVPYL